jgi:putative transcriptional regulator
MKNRLRVLRAERAWSQGELSQRLGVSRQAINAIETEKHDPSLELAFRMAQLFQMSIEQIAKNYVPASLFSNTYEPYSKIATKNHERNMP